MAVGMKNHCLLLIVGCIVLWSGCQSGNQVTASDLEVVEQTDSVYRSDSMEDEASFVVDVPVKGPKLLMDSVIAFVNKQLYDACEGCVHIDENVTSYKQEEVFADDAEQMLSHYMAKYETLIADSLWKTYGLKLKMEAQTKKFVTFGVEHFHCGISCGSEKYYYTFDKGDGHQVKEIISHDDLVSFFKDYPEYNTLGEEAGVDSPLWQFFPESEFCRYKYGLLGDHFSLVIEGVVNHYLIMDFPYSQIFSYLSPEAQRLVEQEGEKEMMLPAYLPERSEDGEVWMEVDTVNHVLLGYIRAAGGPFVRTLMDYEPELEIYPKRVHSIDADGGSTVFLFIYSRGHLLYCDEAMTCVFDEENRLHPVERFVLEEGRDSVISCMWYDQLVEASDGFPYEEVDENRFGIHYDRFTKRLYVPIMDGHDPGSEFANTSCLQYTGRYDVLQFNGKEFVVAGTDGAWWLNSDLRDYKRTVSTKKTADGIEQIDLMPDGNLRRAFWKGAKTLDDLRKVPDEVSRCEK